MKKKQNIPALLLLLLWAVMFCFSVSFTFHKSSPQVYKLTSSSSQHPEKLTSEDQATPLAWTEPTVAETVAEQSKSLLQVFHPISWLSSPAELISSTKPNKSLLAYSGTTIRYLVQPNAP